MASFKNFKKGDIVSYPHNTILEIVDPNKDGRAITKDLTDPYRKGELGDWNNEVNLPIVFLFSRLSKQEIDALPAWKAGKIIKGIDNRLQNLNVKKGDFVINSYDGKVYRINELLGEQNNFQAYELIDQYGEKRVESERPIFQKIDSAKGKKPETNLPPTFSKAVTNPASIPIDLLNVLVAQYINVTDPSVNKNLQRKAIVDHIGMMKPYLDKPEIKAVPKWINSIKSSIASAEAVLKNPVLNRKIETKTTQSVSASSSQGFQQTIATNPDKLSIDYKFSKNIGDRPSPTQSAGELRRKYKGTMKEKELFKTQFKGNNKNWYKLDVDKNGVWRWEETDESSKQKTPVKTKAPESKLKTPRDAAKDMIRVYVLRGDSYESLRSGQMGSYNTEYGASIGGYVNGKKIGNDKIIVEDFMGKKDINEIFSMKELYNEILAESGKKPSEKKPETTDKDLRDALAGAKAFLKYATDKEKNDIKAYIRGLEILLK